MRNIGLLTVNKEMDNSLSQILLETGFLVHDIHSIPQLSKLDGLIIDIGGKEERVAEVCDWLYEANLQTQTFVWILYSTSNRHEQNIYFRLGANAYLSRHDYIENLPNIIKNDLSRQEKSEGKGSDETKKGSNHRIELNELNMSMVIDGDKEVGLTVQEFKVMRSLCARKNTVITYEELEEVLWGKKPGIQRYRLMNVIFHLRQKFDQSTRQCIQTVRSKGYRLYVE